MTNNLKRRVEEHKEGLNEGFSKTYNTHNLIYFEEFFDVKKAIEREKQLKKWNRLWKEELIEKTNPEWRDLYNDLQ